MAMQQIINNLIKSFSLPELKDSGLPVGSTGYWEGLNWHTQAGTLVDAHGRKGLTIPVEIESLSWSSGYGVEKTMLTIWDRYADGSGPVIVSNLSPDSGGGNGGFFGGVVSQSKQEALTQALERILEGKIGRWSNGEEDFFTSYMVRMLTPEEVQPLLTENLSQVQDSLKDPSHLGRQVIETRY